MIRALRLANKYGLAGATLRDLRNVVILAGPNGSGKSRYLQLVNELVRAGPPRLLDCGEILDADPWPTRSALSVSYDKMHRQEAASRGKPAPLPSPQDLERMRFEQLLLPSEGLLRAHVARPLFLRQHPVAAEDPAIRKAHARAEELVELIQALVGIHIDYDIDRDASYDARVTQDGRPFALKELSHGQRVALSWALSLHEQGLARYTEQILLIDEPEVHLHPSGCIAVIDRLRDFLGPKGQIWLATHSPTVVAHFGYESVYLVERGRIAYAGGDVNRVMDGLLGGAENRRRFISFLDDAEHVALLKFAVEALFPPAVASAADRDPQEAQFSRLCTEQVSSGEPLRVLDYCAGRGRFAAALGQVPDESRPKVSYFAWNDPDYDTPAMADERDANLRRLEAAGSEARTIKTLSDLRAPADQVDVVVLCNALHELRPHSWADHFKKLYDILRPNGVVLVMEDQEPRVGELAHPAGFVILGIEELRLLFDCGRELRDLTAAAETRLTVFEVPKHALLRPTRDTLGAALVALRERCLETIERTRDAARDKPADHRAGRRHAFLALQHTNACLALKQLGG